MGENPFILPFKIFVLTHIMIFLIKDININVFEETLCLKSRS